METVSYQLTKRDKRLLILSIVGFLSITGYYVNSYSKSLEQTIASLLSTVKDGQEIPKEIREEISKNINNATFEIAGKMFPLMEIVNVISKNENHSKEKVYPLYK
jgi:cell division protein FtsL